jgi:hypothetical protein
MKITSLLPIILIFLISCASDNSTKNTPANGNLDYTFDTSNASPSQNNLSDEEKLAIEKNKLITEGWSEEIIENGQLGKCYNFKPKYSKIDNRLEITVGSGTDVVVKLMDKKTDKCIRYVFVNSQSIFNIENIPEGIYYLKIAYGKEWMSKVEDGKCTGKFIRNPMYEIGQDEFNFNIERFGDRLSIPSYSLKLDVVSTNSLNSFTSSNISEDVFNQ